LMPAPQIISQPLPLKAVHRRVDTGRIRLPYVVT
jgi:hypothetical protein